MFSNKTFIGIDVSKDTFTAAQRLPDDRWNVRDFNNDSCGIQALINLFQTTQNVHFVLEATGNYSMPLTFALCNAKLDVSVLNPKQSQGFIHGVLLSTTKTDHQDACALVLYGYNNNPPTFKIPSDKILKIRQLNTLLRQLKKDHVAVQNRLHALDFHVAPDPFVQQLLEDNCARLETQIAEVQKRLSTCSKETFKQAYTLALSVKGIGPATAEAILTATNAFEHFDNPKQLAKALGVCPSRHESGSSIRGRGRITKTGDPQLRGLLYMGARSTKRINPACRDLYERLRRKGKCHKVAMVAVCNKMVRQLFAVVKSGVPYQDDFEKMRQLP